MTRRVHGAQGRLDGNAPKFGTRSIMVSSMEGNAVGDGEVIDGNVASKDGDVGDNGEITCGAKVLGGWCGILVWYGSLEGGVEYSGGMEVSSVERLAARQLG